MQEENKLIFSQAMKTPKKNVTSTIRIGIDEWANRNRVPITRLIELGFRHLLDLRDDNKRLSELEEEVARMQRNINKYQTLLAEYRAKEIKKGVKNEELSKE